MELLTKLLRSQVALAGKLFDGFSVEKSRSSQEKLGEFMAYKYKPDVKCSKVPSSDFTAEYIVPEQIESNGIILYLHGGGYVSGKMNYAKGFATILAANNHIRVCCLEYRLAPENKFPAALDDACNAYLYLLENGYSSKNIVLCGESAGGGLVYALSLKLKESGFPLPGGIIAISPWSDLTLSGSSYEENKEVDPSMTRERLQFYAECYTDTVDHPYVSPLFGDLTGLPPSLIFVGGAEIMLSDAVELHKKLLSSGCSSSLHIAPDMWHVYVLFDVKEFRGDYQCINAFLKEVLYGI
ncbi:MAG: alpha/beta hydrolase [Clostridia bacterium]|nr:alpha/beta hydrolase [Clostridia bacterium]